MAKKNTIPMRSHPKFMREMITEIKIKRVKKGKDSPLKPTSTSRITLAMARLPYKKKIVEDIINADLP